jgi:hypothetical protein
MATATLPEISSRRQTIHRFVLAAVSTAVLVMIVGWFTDVRHLLHWILLSLAVTAFLPFVIIGGGLAIGLVLGLVGAVLGADAAGVEVGEGAAEIGVRILHPFYRFLGRRRHPVFWGIPVGMLLGCLLLGAIIALVIVPRETQTVRILAETQQQIEKFHKKTGRFPTPDAEGRLTFKAIGMEPPDAAKGAYVLDGFGQPLHFRVKGKGILASYTLTSWGYDGKPSKDDLCISGSSQVAKWAEQAFRLAEKLGLDKEGNAPPLSAFLRGILDLQCPHEGNYDNG